jgi:hypothetical protein
MPTKRRRIGPKRINQPMPMWAWQLLNGERPDRRDPEVEAGMFAWLLGDPIPGLPDYETAEAHRLRDRSEAGSDADQAAPARSKVGGKVRG